MLFGPQLPGAVVEGEGNIAFVEDHWFKEEELEFSI